MQIGAFCAVDEYASCLWAGTVGSVTSEEPEVSGNAIDEVRLAARIQRTAKTRLLQSDRLFGTTAAETAMIQNRDTYTIGPVQGRNDKLPTRAQR